MNLGFEEKASSHIAFRWGSFTASGRSGTPGEGAYSFIDLLLQTLAGGAAAAACATLNSFGNIACQRRYEDEVGLRNIRQPQVRQQPRHPFQGIRLPENFRTWAGSCNERSLEAT
jgi:hypothetical protein